MDKIIVDSEIRFIPYYPNEKVAIKWYQDIEICKQVDNVNQVYSMDKLGRMYSYLNANGSCYYIEYKGILVGDISLQRSGEIAIVIAKEYQNQGIGKRCIQKIIEIGKESGLQELKARIYDFNKQSQKVFTSLGFEKTGEESYQYGSSSGKY